MMWTTQLLYGHEARLLNVTWMRPDVFNKLLNWLQEYGGLKDTKLLSVSLIWSLTERSIQFQIQPSLS